MISSCFTYSFSKTVPISFVQINLPISFMMNHVQKQLIYHFELNSLLQLHLSPKSHEKFQVKIEEHFFFRRQPHSSPVISESEPKTFRLTACIVLAHGFLLPKNLPAAKKKNQRFFEQKQSPEI